MKNIKGIKDFLLEWHDAPGSVDVPGYGYETTVNYRNYTPATQPLPDVVDSMFESSYFNDFLEEEGNSEEFQEFIDEKKRSSKEISEYLKNKFEIKIKNKK